MSINDEILVYNNVEVSYSTGETESYDTSFFPYVMKQKEVKLIRELFQAQRPSLALDYGCGGGWLSLLFVSCGIDVVGIDVSKNMVKSAKHVCPKADFIICDATRPPFRAGVFDFLIGISILHHLNLDSALNELRRISLVRSVFMFMEPNSLNPLSAFGRKFFSMDAHTKGEKPFTPRYLKTTLKLSNFSVERCFELFFLSFPLARFFKITRMSPPSSFLKIIWLFENIMEKMPLVRGLNSTIVTIGTIHK